MRYLSILFCVALAVVVLYIAGGIVVILHTEAGLASMMKDSTFTGFASAVSGIFSAIAGIFSAIAAFLSYRVADKSAKTAEMALANSKLNDRLRVKDGIHYMWVLLNYKCTQAHYRDLGLEDPFLISPLEAETIESFRVLFCRDSAVFGQEFHGKLLDFYTLDVSELLMQRYLCDQGNTTLSPERQKTYLELRVRMRDEVFELLCEANDLLYQA